MRIWSIHPKYLDTKGLVALWCETLLAKNVLESNTKGYKNHPQLIWFKNSDNPLQVINQYLSTVYQESLTRGYHFNIDKFNIDFHPQTLLKLHINVGAQIGSAHLTEAGFTFHRCS
jgi:hypothetical protein